MLATGWPPDAGDGMTFGSLASIFLFFLPFGVVLLVLGLEVDELLFLEMVTFRFCIDSEMSSRSSWGPLLLSFCGIGDVTERGSLTGSLED
jgi:hypothetical protein